MPNTTTERTNAKRLGLSGAGIITVYQSSGTRAMTTMTTSLSRPWVLIRFGGAPPGARRPGTALAFLIAEAEDCFFGDLVITEWNYTHSALNVRKRHTRSRRIAKSDILHVFPHGALNAPAPFNIAAARQALRADHLIARENR
jgi:hypothetical protein